MATRSSIGILYPDCSVRHIYCHSDGYPSHNGVKLQEHWADQKKVERLLNGGSISILGSVIGKKHDFEWRTAFREDHEGDFRKPDGTTDWEKYYEAMEADPRSAYTRFYKRDRGDTGVEALLSPFWSDNYAYDYAYLWCSQRAFWIVGIWDANGLKWRKLTDVLALGKERGKWEHNMDDDGFVLRSTNPIDLYPPSPEREAAAAALEAVALL